MRGAGVPSCWAPEDEDGLSAPSVGVADSGSTSTGVLAVSASQVDDNVAENEAGISLPGGSSGRTQLNLRKQGGAQSVSQEMVG